MYKNEDLVFNGIVKQMQQHNEKFLNCYISGNSTNNMEHLAYRVIEYLEKQQQRVFIGIVKHFSIEMPYFDTREGALRFLELLTESLSIARDCYDEYRGIVLLECSDEWEKYGINNNIINVIDYLSSLKNIQFIVLETVRYKKHSLLYRAFLLIGTWAFVEFADLSVAQCVNLGISKLQEIGFEVNNKGKQLLQSYLKDRDDSVIDNEVAITQWVNQLAVNKKRTNETFCEISIEEIELLPGVYKNDVKNRIGFKYDGR